MMRSNPVLEIQKKLCTISVFASQGHVTVTPCRKGKFERWSVPLLGRYVGVRGRHSVFLSNALIPIAVDVNFLQYLRRYICNVWDPKYEQCISFLLSNG